MNSQRFWLSEHAVPTNELPSYAAGNLRGCPEKGFLSIICGPDLRISLLALHNGAHVSLHARNDLSMIARLGDLCTQLEIIHAPQDVQGEWSTNSFMIIGDRESVTQLCKVVVESITSQLGVPSVTVSGCFAEVERGTVDGD
jgi:hypothetical protein